MPNDAIKFVVTGPKCHETLKLLLSHSGTDVEAAKASLLLENVSDANMIMRLGEYGWKWSSGALRVLMMEDQPKFESNLATALQQGAVLDGSVIATLSRQKHGCRQLQSLLGKSSFALEASMDERSISAWNLASWQFLAEQGCPWTHIEPCEDFERRAAAIKPSPNGDLTAGQRRALAAVELHRQWLLHREGGCPCQGRCHADHGQRPPAQRSGAQIMAIYDRGFSVVEPFLDGWDCGYGWIYERARYNAEHLSIHKPEMVTGGYTQPDPLPWMLKKVKGTTELLEVNSMQRSLQELEQELSHDLFEARTDDYWWGMRRGLYVDLYAAAAREGRATFISIPPHWAHEQFEIEAEANSF